MIPSHKIIGLAGLALTLGVRLTREGQIPNQAIDSVPVLPIADHLPAVKESRQVRRARERQRRKEIGL